MAHVRVIGERHPQAARAAWMDGCIAAVAAFVIMAGGYGLYDLLMAPQGADRNAAHKQVGEPSRTETGLLGSVLSSGGVELCPGKRQVNVLVLGTDERREGGRADTIMLVMIRKDTKRVAAISIPRDLKVRMPGHGYQKINAVYAYNRRLGTGEIMTVRTIEEIFTQSIGYPLEIDYYVKTDVTKFPSVFDAVGGLDLYVDRRMYYHDRAGGLHIDLQKGMQHLDGEQIEGFVRHRHDRYGRASSDYMRTQRQQYVLKELVRQKTNVATATRLPELVHTLQDMVATNMTGPELVALGLMGKDLDLKNVVSRVLATGSSNTGAGWYAILRTAENRRLLAEVDAALAGGGVAPDESAESDLSIGNGALNRRTEPEAP